MIAYLAWGSLEWDPRKLPVTRPWRTDFPPAPIEFLRQSSDDRITLVLSHGVEPVPSLWSPANVASLTRAVESLRLREHTSVGNIGSWPVDRDDPPMIAGLSVWASQHLIQHVVWTALPPRFEDEEGRVPTADEVVKHLRLLRGSAAPDAEAYVRRASPQIDTAFRRRIANDLEWTPRSK